MNSFYDGDFFEVWYCHAEEWSFIDRSDSNSFEKAMNFAQNIALKNNPDNIRIYAYEGNRQVSSTLSWQSYEELKHDNSCSKCNDLAIGILDNGLCPMCNKSEDN